MIDRGHGYDVTDSFVDDSELVSELDNDFSSIVFGWRGLCDSTYIGTFDHAYLCFVQYEDFVPPQVETVHGGFYINTGQLDFKCRTDLDPE